MAASFPFSLPWGHWTGAPGWPRQLMFLGILWAAILLIFRRDVGDLVQIWWTSSTYSHCLFLPLLIGWLVYQRRGALQSLSPAFWAPALLWLAGGAMLWLLGESGGLGVLRHGALIIMMQGAVGVILGPAVVWSLLFPLFYAFFMVPVGSELEPNLQLLTAKMAVEMLHFMQVPAHIEGIFITTPTGYFKVAEACSGAKFLIAMAAYGVLVCNVCFKSWLRRIVFLAGALITCLVANGVRAFGIIYVAHKSSIESAVGIDHVVYGWLFFAVVMLIVMAAAWPFFDRQPTEQAIAPPALQQMRFRSIGVMKAMAASLAIVIAPPSWSMISTHWGAASLAPPVLPEIAGWEKVSLPASVPWSPRFEGADHLAQARYADARGRVVDLAIATYGAQNEGREMIGFGQGAVDPDGPWSWSSPAPAPAYALGEEITAPGPVVRHVISFYRIGDGPLTGREMQVKLATMKARLLGRDQRATAILLSAEQKSGQNAQDAMADFLAALGNVQDLADAAARTR